MDTTTITEGLVPERTELRIGTWAWRWDRRRSAVKVVLEGAPDDAEDEHDDDEWEAEPEVWSEPQGGRAPWCGRSPGACASRSPRRRRRPDRR